MISEQPLDHLVPVENAAMAERTIIQWDKDDLDAVGLLKVDILALGMLSAIRRCFDLLRRHRNLDLSLASIPSEDAPTYDMIGRADTIGVFQIESRAQMSMLPRLKPRKFYDLVIEVAIVRPGPIQGGMVHPYLRRRNKEELESYPSGRATGGVEAHPGGSTVSGASDADRHCRRRLQPWRGRPVAPFHGGLETSWRAGTAQGPAGRRHEEKRLHG